MNERSPAQSPVWWKFWTWKLHWQILCGLLLGAAGGWGLAQSVLASATEANPAARILAVHPVRLVAQAGGDMFLAGLKMIVVPLVLSSIILSIASIAHRQGFARMGLRTLLFYGLTGLVAILIGLFLVNTLRPGVAASGQPLLNPDRIGGFTESFGEEQKKLEESARLDQQRAGETVLSRILAVIRSLVPPNIIKAMAELDLLGLIVYAILFGFFLSRLPPDLAQVMRAFWDGVNRISMGMTEAILAFAPLGICMLLIVSLSENFVKLSGDNRIGEFGGALWWFAITVLLALVIHVFGVMSLVMWIFGRVSPWQNLKAFLPAMLTAFSTSSSNATISVTLDCAERRAGVSNEIASFVIPLGATVNMNGTALYECVAAMFVCQLFGIELDLATQFLVVLMALLTSVGVAGVPSASLVAILIILDSVSRQVGGGIDLAMGLPILLILDRPLDMCRTVANVFGDGCAAVVIARGEGERPLSGPIPD